MTKKEAYETLVTAFRALPKRDRERLRYHWERRTPVLCGVDDALYFADGAGGG